LSEIFRLEDHDEVVGQAVPWQFRPRAGSGLSRELEAMFFCFESKPRTGTLTFASGVPGQLRRARDRSHP
jgi:hypothetical protein